MRSRLTVSLLEDRLTPADFRIVTYNVTSADTAPRSGMNAILQAIGSQTVGGLARPIDVLAIQETDTNAAGGSTADIVALMNGLYGAGKYAKGSLNGATTGSGTQGIVYRTDSFSFIGESALGVANGTGQPRQTLRYQLRPLGTTGSNDLYIYVAHMKSADDTTSAGRRTTEVNVMRANADALPAGAFVLYVGDFNLYRTAETAYNNFFSAGNGQASDVGNPARSWVRDSNSWVSIYTQAPAANPPAGFTGGGLDDRFDFILTSTELNDGTGFDIRTGSYHTFGNNGTTARNGSVNAAGNTSLANTGLSAAMQQTVLDALTTVADHLPVVLDLTLPDTTPSIQFATSAFSVGEASGLATITVTRTAGTGSSTISYAATAGTATVSSDFTATFGSLVFNAGVTSLTFTIPITNDTLNEANETINLALTVPAGSPNATLGSQATATLTIVDNDPLIVSSYAVNGSAAAQRSRVTSVQVTFNGAVALSASNFTITNFAGAIGVATASLSGQTVATLTFSGSGTTNGSLTNGRYTLNVTGVTGLTGTTSYDFFRLYGDSDGNARADAQDVTAFLNGYGTSQANGNFVAYLDSDGNGSIDAQDVTAFLNVYGITLP